MKNIYFDIGFPPVSALLLETKKEVVSWYCGGWIVTYLCHQWLSLLHL